MVAAPLTAKIADIANSNARTTGSVDLINTSPSSSKDSFLASKVRDRIFVPSAVVAFQLMLGAETSFAEKA